jgi:hypothetical protein
VIYHAVVSCAWLQATCLPYNSSNSALHWQCIILQHEAFMRSSAAHGIGSPVLHMELSFRFPSKQWPTGCCNAASGVCTMYCQWWCCRLLRPAGSSMHCIRSRKIHAPVAWRFVALARGLSRLASTVSCCRLDLFCRFYSATSAAKSSVNAILPGLKLNHAFVTTSRVLLHGSSTTDEARCIKGLVCHADHAQTTPSLTCL